MKGEAARLVAYMEGSDKRFVIPVYQRNYDWRLENCKQLFDDLVKVIKKDRKSHFFGSIVSVHSDGAFNEFQIIDGQQRLTTISLLFLAMYNLMKAGVVVPKRGNLADMIYETYLIDKRGSCRRRAIETAERRLTSNCGNSSAASLLAEYTEAPASDTIM